MLSENAHSVAFVDSGASASSNGQEELQPEVGNVPQGERIFPVQVDSLNSGGDKNNDGTSQGKSDEPTNLSVWLGPVDPARVSMISGTNFIAISTTVLSRLPSSLARGFASSMSFVRFSSAGAEPNFLAYSSAEYLQKFPLKFWRNTT